MRVVVSREQHFFFERCNYLCLENVLTNREIDDLTQAAERELLMRWSAQPQERFDDSTVLFGKNLSLSSEPIRKILFSLRLSEIAFQLTNKRPLRFGFDQMWRIPHIPTDCTIDSLSSVAPLVVGVIIALDERRGVKEEMFPFERGSVTFISPTLRLCVPQGDRGRFLLMAFAHDRPQYRFQPSDVHTHELKRLGYVFGDILKETTHPVLYR
jgi:hypothetical protein